MADPAVPAELYHQHANPNLAAMAMHATSKPPFNTAESFMTETFDFLDTVDVLLATGEFDPNLVAQPGGSREVAKRLRRRPLLNAQTKLVVLESTGHGSVAMRPKLVAATILVSKVEVVGHLSLSE